MSQTGKALDYSKGGRFRQSGCGNLAWTKGFDATWAAEDPLGPTAVKRLVRPVDNLASKGEAWV